MAQRRENSLRAVRMRRKCGQSVVGVAPGGRPLFMGVLVNGVFMALLAAVGVLLSCGGATTFVSAHDDDTMFGRPDPHKSAGDASLEAKALFTHKANELHCPDRELIHPCADEMKAFLKDAKEGADKDLAEKKAYACSQKVYEVDESFWNLKNMTHLLLDLDTSDHNFDRDTKDNDWIQLGLSFGKKLLAHPECMGELEKEELECRCPLLYGKIMLLKLKNAGRWDEAEELFSELKDMEWHGEKKQYKKGEVVKWQSIHQTPQIWLDNLKTEPVWGEDRRKDLPIWDVLENNYKMIADEVAAAITDPGALDQTYRFLFQGGNWTQILLFHDRKYTDQCEKLMPQTCDLLKKELPKREVHHYPWTSNQNEQVLVLKMDPGTDVETHCGPANNILNVHLGISGCEGANLIIAGKKYGWEEGKVIAWDGSYDHKVDCLECKKPRIIMMVRYMHPDITKEHYKGNKWTHHEKVPREWWPEDWKDEDLDTEEKLIVG